MAGPAWVAPMLAQGLRFPTEQAPLLSGEWFYERKLDGLRCIAVRDEGRVELWSRNHLSFNRRFPAMATAIGRLPVPSFVLDGEIVAFDGDRTSFQLLQEGTTAEPVLVAFDLLHLLGEDTTGLPLADRSDLLRRAVDAAPHPGVLLSEHLDGSPGQLMETACARGWEGLVAKRATSVYRSGRSPDWRKLKCTARQELVIGGWSEPSGSRTGFGALLVGYYEGDRFLYAGKVGTGFDERTLRDLRARLGAMEVPEPAFVNPLRGRGTHWVRPELVAEIAFTEWTRDGRLRHPSFLGLRPDKTARSVVREHADPG